MWAFYPTRAAALRSAPVDAPYSVVDVSRRAKPHPSVAEVLRTRLVAATSDPYLAKKGKYHGI